MARLHHGDPAPGEAVRAPLVEQGDDLLLQQLVGGAGLDQVLVAGVGVLLALADGPAQAGAVGLGPPAVEDAEVQHRR